jgi:hypothetical protein
MARTKHEKYDIQTISREAINMAQYNPRFIDEKNKKALEKGLKKNGLVEPLIWNKRTGNLVSGHQRISILDKLERGTNYELTVAAVDLDETEEKILNVQLNNQTMQGQFDIGLLGDLALDADINFGDFGFDDFDVKFMFGDDDHFQELFPDSKDVTAAKEDIKDIKANREAMNEKYKLEQNADFYFVVVCESQKEKDELLKQMSVPLYEQYVTGKSLRRLYPNTLKGT